MTYCLGVFSRLHKYKNMNYSYHREKNKKQNDCRHFGKKVIDTVQCIMFKTQIHLECCSLK